MEVEPLIWMGETVGSEDEPTEYLGFTRGDLIVSVGDHVLVRGVDEDDMIGKVESLYDTKDENSDCGRRAELTWYTRVGELPKRILNAFPSHVPALHSALEVVRDLRTFEKDVDADTIVGKCSVVYADAAMDPEQVVMQYVDSCDAVYVARFQLSGRGRRLEPISSSVEIPLSPRKTKPAKQPAIVRMADLVEDAVEKHEASPAKLKKKTELGYHKAQEVLHVSAVPESLPCREEEFAQIYQFVESHLSNGTGGCMYVSGVPGTGKTATVQRAIAALRRADLPPFDFVDVNGMRLLTPHQAYVELYRGLVDDSKVTADHAASLLEKHFSRKSAKKSAVVLADELDLLCTRKQDVLYNLFEWPCRPGSRLVVLGIANTMDLPERMLVNRIASRLGMTRLTFTPYTHRQLQEIVLGRVQSLGVFDGDAVQLVARKVAAVSGDARRALDLCRRAVEVAERSRSPTVGLKQVTTALDEMSAQPSVLAIRSCSPVEKAFLVALASEAAHLGREEVEFSVVYRQALVLCRLDRLETPSVGQAMEIADRLRLQRLVLVQGDRVDWLQKLQLNVSQDDVHFATKI